MSFFAECTANIRVFIETTKVLKKNLKQPPFVELSPKLVEKLSLSRPVVSKFITQMVKDGKLFDSGKHIMNSSQTMLAL